MACLTVLNIMVFNNGIELILWTKRPWVRYAYSLLNSKSTYICPVILQREDVVQKTSLKDKKKDLDIHITCPRTPFLFFMASSYRYSNILGYSCNTQFFNKKLNYHTLLDHCTRPCKCFPLPCPDSITEGLYHSYFDESYSMNHHKLISGLNGKHLLLLDSNPRP